MGPEGGHEVDQPTDPVHESHREFLSGPAQIALRDHIRAHRRRLPRPLRVSLWISLGLLGASAVLVTGLAIFDPGTLAVLAQMFGLSFAVGREAAMVYAYGQRPSMGPAWPFIVAALSDLLTIGLTLPAVWLGIERLREAFFIGGVVLSLEKTAAEKRAFVRKWGVVGLVAFIWAPGVGTGVFLAGTMGIVSKVPQRRLIIALMAGSLAVNAFWAVALFYTSSFIPADGIWSYTPLAFVAALVVVAAVFAVREHRKRHLFPIVKVQILGKQHVERLLAVGIADGIDLLYANRTILAAKLGMDPALLGQLRSVAELSMLRTVSPRHAEMLTEVGITTVRELAVSPWELVAAALTELELKHTLLPAKGEEEVFPAQCRAWVEDARVFLAESDA